MQRAGIRGNYRSPAGLTATATPTGTLVARDLKTGRLNVGSSPIADALILTSDPIFGAYTDPADIGRFEKQMNRPIQLVTAFTDSNNPDITANTFPFDLQWPGDRKLILSHALIGYGWDMADSASGAHNADYADAVDNLVPWRDRIFSIRIGWEFNADFTYPWTQGAAGGTNQTPSNYAASFANFANIIREEMPGVLIDWCPLSDWSTPDPWYPGDEYVDIIGCDCYVKEAYHPNSFAYVLTTGAGLYWQETFAQAHGKLMGYPEWATDYVDGADWIAKMAEWMRRPRTGRVIYQSYWNSNSVVSSALDDKPLNLAAYKTAFGEPI